VIARAHGATRHGQALLPRNVRPQNGGDSGGGAGFGDGGGVGAGDDGDAEPDAGFEADRGVGVGVGDDADAGDAADAGDDAGGGDELERCSPRRLPPVSRAGGPSESVSLGMRRPGCVTWTRPAGDRHSITPSARC
jgi:hypothetical protein